MRHSIENYHNELHFYQEEEKKLSNEQLAQCFAALTNPETCEEAFQKIKECPPYFWLDETFFECLCCPLNPDFIPSSQSETIKWEITLYLARYILNQRYFYDDFLQYKLQSFLPIILASIFPQFFSLRIIEVILYRAGDFNEKIPNEKHTVFHQLLLEQPNFIQILITLFDSTLGIETRFNQKSSLLSILFIIKDYMVFEQFHDAIQPLLSHVITTVLSLLKDIPIDPLSLENPDLQNEQHLTLYNNFNDIYNIIFELSDLINKCPERMQLFYQNPIILNCLQRPLSCVISPAFSHLAGSIFGLYDPKKPNLIEEPILQLYTFFVASSFFIYDVPSKFLNIQIPIFHTPPQPNDFIQRKLIFPEATIEESALAITDIHLPPLLISYFITQIPEIPNLETPNEITPLQKMISLFQEDENITFRTKNFVYNAFLSLLIDFDDENIPFIFENNFLSTIYDSFSVFQGSRIIDLIEMLLIFLSQNDLDYSELVEKFGCDEDFFSLLKKYGPTPKDDLYELSIKDPDSIKLKVMNILGKMQLTRFNDNN